MNTVYLGEWQGKSVYQPEYDPQTWEGRCLMVPNVSICASKCTRWFRTAQEDYREGLCHSCYVSQYEGEEEMPL